MGGVGSGPKLRKFGEVAPTAKEIVKETGATSSRTVDPALRMELCPEIIDGRPCWERMTGEGYRAWSAFQIFRDLSPAIRSLTEVLTRLNKIREEAIVKAEKDGTEVPKDVAPRYRLKLGHLRKWAQQYLWYERTDWYDRHLDSHRIVSAEKEAEEMGKRHLSVAAMMQAKAVRRLQALDESTLTPKQALEFIVEGVKLERITRGKETERISTNAPEQKTPLNEGGEDISTPDQAMEELQRRLAEMAERKKRSGQPLKVEPIVSGPELVKDHPRFKAG